jgi:hypothetical protein
MVQPGPTLGDRLAGHWAEGARLGRGAQVDVPDDHREEEDERDVVRHVAVAESDLILDVAAGRFV